jgi:hypothetical protein
MTEATGVSERQPQDPGSTHRNQGHPPRFLGFVVEREDDLPQPREWEANPRPTFRNRGWGIRRIFGFARAVRQDAWVEILRRVSQSLGDWETVAPQDDMGLCGGEIRTLLSRGENRIFQVQVRDLGTCNPKTQVPHTGTRGTLRAFWGL